MRITSSLTVHELIWNEAKLKNPFYVVRDRVTADDIIGTKFLLLSEISGNGGTGMLQDIIYICTNCIRLANR